MLNLLDWDAERYAGEAAPITWLIEGVIPLGVAWLLAAMGGIGKSFSLLDLGLRVATGDPDAIRLAPIMGGNVVSFGTAVIVTAEDSYRTVHRRLDAIDPKGSRHNSPERLIVVPLPDAGGPLPFVRNGKSGPEVTPEFEMLREQLLAIPDLRLVGFDPLQAFVTANMNDPEVGQFMCGLLGRLAAETGATVMVTHHMRKTDKPIQNAAEARDAVRGSTALIDGVRLGYALWEVEQKEGERICKLMDVTYKRQSVVRGAVIKSNDEADLNLHTYVREKFGLLREVTQDFRKSGPRLDILMEKLASEIARGAQDGHPFTKSGTSGIYEQLERLPVEFRGFGRDRLRNMVQKLLEERVIVQCLATGANTAKWLDKPDGPFALGNGEFRKGAAA